MIPVNRSVVATFDMSGRAVGIVSPERPGQQLIIRRITTTIADANQKEQLSVYKDFESLANYLDGSRRAYRDVSETYIPIGPQEKLLLVWTGGTFGKTATAFLSGELY